MNSEKAPQRKSSDIEKWAWWREMSEKDRFFEYKMPISFYGRVVDDKGSPVSGAKMQCTWTDLSSNGTSKRDLESNANGFFSLEGATGKGLLIAVRKEGYKPYFSKNQFSFEYAMFADPNYHIPDKAHPVIFVLRKNRETEALIAHLNQEAELAPGQKKAFSIGPGDAAVLVERLPNIGNGPGGWAARVSVPGGGLVISTEEFPFEAPESGYSPVVEVTDKTPKPPTWSGDNGAAFFVKTPKGYGRITVRNTPGMSWVYVSSYLNPKPGSRNLE